MRQNWLHLFVSSQKKDKIFPKNLEFLGDTQWFPALTACSVLHFHNSWTFRHDKVLIFALTWLSGFFYSPWKYNFQWHCDRCIWQPVTANIGSYITMFWPDQNKISAHFFEMHHEGNKPLSGSEFGFLQMSGIEWNQTFDIKCTWKIKIKKLSEFVTFSFWADLAFNTIYAL